MTTQTQTAAPPKQFTLADVTSGKQEQPILMMLAGVEGIGKSTFGANAPAPIFLGAEKGTGFLDVKRLPQPKTWADVFHALSLLRNEQHGFKTLVVDTVDWLEPLCWAFVCQRDKKFNAAGEPDIEEYGYGKGYNAAIDEWRKLIRAIEPLRDRGMHVVLLAHTHLKTFKNPLGEDYDRYELKLHLKAGGLLKEWVDAVLFANYETFAVKKDATSKFEKAKGISSGARYIYTERTAGYDAKNRYGLPPQLALSWSEFEKAARAGQPAEPKMLLAEIAQKSALLETAEQEAVKASLGRAGMDAAKLSQILNYVNTKTPTQPKEG